MNKREHIVNGLLAIGVAVLLWSPVAWLLRRWLDPHEGGLGWVVALAVGGLVAWSVRSGPAPEDPRATRLALRLLAATAATRLVGQVLAIDIIGALALVVDVWAMGLLLRLHARPRALRPVALASLFAFALPLEAVLQRVLGYPLRWASAVAAEVVLFPFHAVERQGTLLVRGGVELGVDLPCSGAQGLLLLSSAVALAWTARRAGWRLSVGVLTALGGAFLANIARIVLLFVGVVRGWPVMADPWHDIVGLVALALGALPVLLVVRRWPRRAPRPGAPLPRRRMPVLVALAFVALACGITVAPARPIDVGSSRVTAGLPISLADFRGMVVPLSAEESSYFARYGGAAHKVRYRDGRGPDLVALRVQTTAPLRHLHGPDRCLTGAGHRVERLGIKPGALPVVVWRSVDPDGVPWRVETLFVDARGRTAATVSEVVWRWIREPQTPWNLIERIAPWGACESTRCAAFDAALYTALDLEMPR